MNTPLNQLSWSLIDYQLGATVLLGIALLGLWLSRQPARRVAVGWSAALSLVVLAVAAALPIWPKWHSINHASPVSTPPQTSAQSPIRDSVSIEPLATPPQHESFSTPAHATPPQPATVSHTPISVPVLPLLTRVFLLGAAAVSLWLLLGVIEAIWLCRTARPAPQPLLAQLRTIHSS